MTPGPSSRRTTARALAGVYGAGLLVLVVLVGLGLTRPVDAAVREWARPDDVWGALQVRADVVVEGLRPVSTLVLTAAVAAGVSLARRSVRPVLAATGAVLVMVVVTVGLKLLLHRPDPHGALSDHGGSFPSGHTATLVVCAGLVTILLRPRGPRWWWLVTLLLGTLMAGALLVQAAHWLTDLVGGALVGGMVLAALVAVGADGWCAVARRPALVPTGTAMEGHDQHAAR